MILEVAGWPLAIVTLGFACLALGLVGWIIGDAIEFWRKR